MKIMRNDCTKHGHRSIKIKTNIKSLVPSSRPIWRLSKLAFEESQDHVLQHLLGIMPCDKRSQRSTVEGEIIYPIFD